MQFSIITNLCLVASAASAAVVTIEVGNPTAADQPAKLSFVPDVVKVDPEDTVRFVFNGNHTVTEQSDFNQCERGTKDGGAPFDSGVMTKGEVFELPKSAMIRGSIVHFYCRINKGAHCREPNFMQGAIVISGDSEAAGSAEEKTESDAKEGENGSTSKENETETPSKEGENGENGLETKEEETGSETSKDSKETNTEASPATVTVVVGKDGKNQYSPSDIKASAGDTILFKWTGGAKMHNVVPSDQPNSCVRSSQINSQPVLKALFSGAPQNSGEKSFVVPKGAKPGDSLNFFCSVATHCSADKMYATINIVAPGTATNSADEKTETPNADQPQSVDPAADPAADPSGTSQEASAGAVVSSASSVTASLALFGTAVAAAFMML